MRGNKGITLIALVVTIIVLLILAGVTIAMLNERSSIPQKTTEAVVENARGEACDRINLALDGIFANLYSAEYDEGASIPDEKDGQFILEENGMDSESLPNSIGSYTAEYHKDIIEKSNGENGTGTVVKITWHSPDTDKYGADIEGRIERVKNEKEKITYRKYTALSTDAVRN